MDELDLTDLYIYILEPRHACTDRRNTVQKTTEKPRLITCYNLRDKRYFLFLHIHLKIQSEPCEHLLQSI
ncbi:unnamed protein product [Parnassius apollo]|uniref:(apollo) hypothetical protein n=1 Tax=Parnassius apollo TaxID=110799 RepID=A0A8S3XHS4_PARAO|nr:unnamed protein product [Parnassius apollo]